MLMVTGIMAGITLSAMAAQAATTGDIKDTKSKLLKPNVQKNQAVQTQKNAKTAIKSWKNSTPRFQAKAGKRYLGGYRAWYGDSHYFGTKALKKSYNTTRRYPTYTNRYYRPSEARARIAQRDYRTPRAYGYGYSSRTAPQCRMQPRYNGYGSHRCPCCCR